MNISITEWRDIEDNHVYHAGDKYPYDGRKVSDARIAALTSAQNRLKYPLIKSVGEEPPKAADKPKTAKKPRKKTT